VHITPLPETINHALRIFSEVGVVKFATKSAGTFGTPRFEATVHFAGILGERMAFFANVDWDGIDGRHWARREAERLERAMRAGASGIKIFKALGLGVRLKNGRLLAPDDKRLDPLWRRAAKVKAIVAWHVADPVAFFRPVTPDNERYDELSHAPEWSFFGGDFPSHEALLAARDRVLARHPQTTFLGIHLANHPEDLDYVDRLLRRHENLYIDVSARLPEIGRHPPEKVRAFFIRHQDRILFGTDLIVGIRGMQLGSLSEKPPTFDDAIAFYEAHRRFFETDQRQIDHPTPIQGRWKIDAIDLPDPVLKKIYLDNADRLIFAPRRRWLAERGTVQRNKVVRPPRAAE
jgi:predicted TIM-barrel fold metal-dependent hydrolase